jgi:dipeptidyl aminopeptidase/acylaminoacyl peptidase
VDAKSGGKTSRPVPLLLYVHGGPQARDYWAFDTYPQLLANRGYAIMQVRDILLTFQIYICILFKCNYRGSTGFGKRFLNAGNGEWAGKMQTDLLDAVQWAIDNNVTQKDTVGIWGM